MSKAEEIKKKCHFAETEKYATISGGYVKDEEHYEFTPDELREFEKALELATLQELKEQVEGKIANLQPQYENAKDESPEYYRIVGRLMAHRRDLIEIEKRIETIEGMQDN